MMQKAANLLPGHKKERVVRPDGTFERQSSSSSSSSDEMNQVAIGDTAGAGPTMYPPTAGVSTTRGYDSERVVDQGNTGRGGFLGGLFGGNKNHVTNLPEPGLVPVVRHDVQVDHVDKEIQRLGIAAEERHATVVDQVAREVVKTDFVPVERKEVVTDHVDKEIVRTEFVNVPRTKEVVDLVDREVEVIDYVPVPRKEIVTDRVVRQVEYNEEVPVQRREIIQEPVDRVVSHTEEVPIERREIVVENVPREVAYREDVAIPRRELIAEPVERIAERVVEEPVRVRGQDVFPSAEVVEETKCFKTTALGPAHGAVGGMMHGRETYRETGYVEGMDMNKDGMIDGQEGYTQKQGIAGKVANLFTGNKTQTTTAGAMPLTANAGSFNQTGGSYNEMYDGSGAGHGGMHAGMTDKLAGSQRVYDVHGANGEMPSQREAEQVAAQAASAEDRAMGVGGGTYEARVEPGAASAAAPDIYVNEGQQSYAGQQGYVGEGQQEYYEGDANIDRAAGTQKPSMKQRIKNMLPGGKH